ncbi:hypothetical protein ACFQDN_04670 [Pseudomonas asuensis]|uniref:Uncharacterized protein n=1 Tax=Pseudomonas asuensis TaxID=1825787 RepID=A0ABQ2GT45_9PSED|nr:hypothetical protein [Pseudomonas asuensis]GGM12022.1 hypothetical protein GCM10009425_23800 [Pseudomonas asuensis]
MAQSNSCLSAQQEIDSLLDHLQAANDLIEHALAMIAQVHRGEKSPEELKPLRDAFSSVISLQTPEHFAIRH